MIYRPHAIRHGGGFMFDTLPTQIGAGLTVLVVAFAFLKGDEPERIARYLRLFEKADVKKLQAGEKVFIEKDEWQLLP